MEATPAVEPEATPSAEEETPAPPVVEPEPVASAPPSPSSQERAAAERRPIEALAGRQADAGELAAAARTLAVGADAYHDPQLHLAAAEHHHALAQRRGRAGVADDDRCIAHAREAQRLLQATPAGASRVDPERRAELDARAAALIDSAGRHKLEVSTRRDGRGQLIAGALLTTVGLAGAGVMTRGLQLGRISDRELAREGAWSEAQLAPLHAQKERGETMLAAGAVVGAMGLILGAALLAGGARNLKAARAERLARVRVAPTLGGLLLVGKF